MPLLEILGTVVLVALLCLSLTAVFDMFRPV